MATIYKNALFIHVHRTAGTSIEEVLVDAGGEMLDCPGWGRLAQTEHLIQTEVLSRKDIQNMWTFIFTRNPWEQYKSIYRIEVQRGNCSTSFHKYLFNRISTRNTIPQSRYFLSETEYDFIGRFSDLKRDWKRIALKLGGLPDTLPRLDSTNSTPNTPVYHKSDIELVRNTERSLIERFGYGVPNDI